MLLKIIKNLKDYSNLKTNDVLLVSYPKSGNTWVRFLLCNYLEYIQSDLNKVDFEYLNKNMPEFGFNLHQNQYFGKYNRVVKTHKKCLPIFKKKSSIYIIRHPKSVLKSFFHYNNNLTQNTFFDKSTFSQFIDSQYGIQGYLEHYKSWKDELDLQIRYEDIEKNPFTTLKQMVNFLQYPFSEKAILYAIEQSDKSQLTGFKNGHKEALKPNYNFSGNNAMNSQLKFSVADLKLIQEQFTRYNFSVYDLDND